MKKFLIILSVVFAVVLLRFALSPVLEQLELKSYDMRAKIAVDKGPFSKKFAHASKDIVIVTVDDYSRNEITKHPELKLGAWPWRRDVWAEATDFIEKGEPKAILFDIIFNDVDDSRPYDRELSLAFRQYGNIVLATALNNPKNMADKIVNENIQNSDYLPTSKPLEVEVYDKDIEQNISYLSHTPVAERFTKYNTMAVVNMVSGKDEVLRKAQPVFKLIKGDETYYLPSLAFAGFLKAVGDDGTVVIKNNMINYKGRQIPIDDAGTTNISWHGQGGSNVENYKYIHISDLLLSANGQGDIEPDFFKDKIVIIGRTETGTDIKSSSVNVSLPGPEANAVAIDNFINDSDLNNPMARKFVTETPIWVEYLLIFLLAGVFNYCNWKSKSAFLGVINTFLLIFFYVLMSIYLFVNPDVRLWLPVAVPLYYIIMSSIIVYSVKLHMESAKKTEIMGMFGKFVSPKVLSTLLKESEGLVLKNTKKHISILFCDVKDFTTLSEKSNPEQLVENLNELFNEIVNIIFENNGTVDKFVGDCVMAYWGDPIASDDDAFMAVKTALEIRKKIDELKITNVKEGKIVFDVKIGINTGDALLGLAGSDKIMSYTAMGDAVNTASRLETACTRLNRDVLISKATYDETHGKVIVIEAGKITVKGKDEEIEVFEPIGFTEK